MKFSTADFLRAAPVLVVVAAVLLIFPFKAVSFRASDAVSVKHFPVSFIQLTPQQEESAVLKAKTAWLDGSELRGRMTAHLPLVILPELVSCPLLGDEKFLPAAAPMPLIPWPKRPFTPSQAAPYPSQLPQLPIEAPKPFFSREELLNIDMKGTKQ